MAYELIETVEVGAGGAASIEFTSIPQDGTDLVLTTSFRSAGTSGILLRFNSDATTGAYNWVRLQGKGDGSVSSALVSSTAYLGDITKNTMTANTFSSSQFYFSNYTSSSYKSISAEDLFEDNSTSTEMKLIALQWKNTSAINTITITCSSDLAQYSSASLYKVTAA